MARLLRDRRDSDWHRNKIGNNLTGLARSLVAPGGQTGAATA
jgi:hypothetical protein